MKAFPHLQRFLVWLGVGVFGAIAPSFSAAAGNEYHVYIGTYTGSKSKGIYLSRFDPGSGKLSPPQLAAATPHPTFLALHPNQRFLYAANEIGDFGGKKSGAVSAFAIDGSSGKLRPLNQQASGGTGPCHLSVDMSGRNVLVANYGGGSIAAIGVNEDGSLGAMTAFVQHTGGSVNKQRQEAAHAHYITPDPDNRFALTCDLGLDQVRVYRWDPAKGSLVANDPPAASLPGGAGPRHLAFHPNGKFVYVINELNSTLTGWVYDAAGGRLKVLQSVSTLPEGFSGNNTTAEVEVHPSGKYVYGSNRGHDSIAVFEIEEASGRLSLVQHQSTRGKMPRHFAIDPTGSWLIAENQASDNVSIFLIDPRSGRLEPMGQPLSVPSPVCLKFLPAK